MKVVLYMRYSSDRQTEQSIEGQNRVCGEFCKREGYEIVGTYIDRATSAFKDTDKRTEFQRMIKDSDKMQWQGVVVYKLDRFARNRFDSATFKAKLKKNGVRVISATENISDNPEGVILESVLEGMAEFYSKELSQKITRGRTESAHKCNSLGGYIPLGYKVVNKKFVIDEAGAVIVREAFAMYASGSSMAEIISSFNDRGFRTTKGSKFNKNSFHSMFKNERYIGVYKYKDLRIENGMPAIVDEETFAAVQARLVKNSDAPARGRAKVKYLLSQKLFCGHCESPMVGETGTGKGGQSYHYYTCAKRKRQQGCDKKPIRKDLIEEVVAKNAIALLTPKLIDEIAEIAMRESERQIEENSIIPELLKKHEEVKTSIKRLVGMVEKGVELEYVAERITQLEDERKAIEQRLSALYEDYVVLEKEHIIYWLEGFTKGNIEDEDFRQTLIDLLVNKVIVWDESDGGYKLTIAYNLTKENKTVECSDIDQLWTCQF